jgi:hypothetical protein
MDRHRFAADPDPNFQVYAAPDPGTDWHQNMLENQNFFLLVTALTVYNLSH